MDRTTDTAVNSVRGLGALLGDHAVSQPVQRSTVVGSRFRPGPLSSAGTNDTVIQRKLVRGSLNIVGERHDKSPRSEALEREYASKVIGGGYWGENQFRLPSPRGQGEGDVADPFDLRFLHGLLFLKQHLDHFDAEKEAKKAKYDSAHHFHENLVTMIGNLQGGYEGTEVEPAAQQAILKLEGPLKRMGQPPSKIMGMLQSGMFAGLAGSERIFMEGDSKQDSGTAGALIAMLSAVLNKLKRIGSGDSDDVRTRRSQAMHQAAQAEQGRPGMWKVGQTHFDDITEWHHDGSGYGLTSGDEMERELARFGSEDVETYLRGKAKRDQDEADQQKHDEERAAYWKQRAAVEDRAEVVKRLVYEAREEASVDELIARAGKDPALMSQAYDSAKSTKAKGLETLRQACVELGVVVK